MAVCPDRGRGRVGGRLGRSEAEDGRLLHELERRDVACLAALVAVPMLEPRDDEPPERGCERHRHSDRDDGQDGANRPVVTRRRESNRRIRDQDDDGDPRAAVQRDDERYEREEKERSDDTAPEATEHTHRHQRERGQQDDGRSPFVRVVEEGLRSTDREPEDPLNLREPRRRDVVEEAHLGQRRRKDMREDVVGKARKRHVCECDSEEAAHHRHGPVDGQRLHDQAGRDRSFGRGEDVDEEDGRGEIERPPVQVGDGPTSVVDLERRGGDPREEEQPDPESRRDANAAAEQEAEQHENAIERQNDVRQAEDPRDRQRDKEEVDRPAR